MLRRKDEIYKFYIDEIGGLYTSLVVFWWRSLCCGLSQSKTNTKFSVFIDLVSNLDGWLQRKQSKMRRVFYTFCFTLRVRNYYSCIILAWIIIGSKYDTTLIYRSHIIVILPAGALSVMLGERSIFRFFIMVVMYIYWILMQICKWIYFQDF